MKQKKKNIEKIQQLKNGEEKKQKMNIIENKEHI